MVATINNTDISQYIQESSYDVNQYEDYKEWKDGNARRHRTVFRTYIEGKFELAFTDSTSLTAFLTLLSNNTVNGVLTITLSVQNTDTTAEIGAFYELKTKTDRAISAAHFLKIYELSLIER